MATPSGLAAGAAPVDAKVSIACQTPNYVGEPKGQTVPVTDLKPHPLASGPQLVKHVTVVNDAGSDQTVLVGSPASQWYPLRPGVAQDFEDIDPSKITFIATGVASTAFALGKAQGTTAPTATYVVWIGSGKSFVV